MPKIYKNGIEFVSTSNIASNIEFDDTNANLKAYTVQSAIEKLKGTIRNLSILAPTLVNSVDAMTDRSKNYVLTTTKEIYQWIDNVIRPTGIYYKMSDVTATLDFSEFGINIEYDSVGNVNKITQVSGESNLDITFEYEGNSISSITETDGVNTVKTALTYNEDGDVENINRKIQF